jgi:hypothetical protein
MLREGDMAGAQKLWQRHLEKAADYFLLSDGADRPIDILG